MNKKSPTVSIIMPVYNAEKVLERSIGSVCRQSYTDWELITANDASTDQSLQRLRDFAAQEPRIKIKEIQENSGAGIARNRAIEAAQGRYLAFLDADDEWFPQKLQRHLEFMQQGEYAFSCTSYQRKRSGSQRTRVAHVPKRAIATDLLKNNTVGTSTAMYDTAKLGKVLMADIRRRQDLDLWLKLLQITDAVYGLDEDLTLYHIGSNTLSSNKARIAIEQWRFYRRVQKLNLPNALYYFAHYCVNSTLRNL